MRTARLLNNCVPALLVAAVLALQAATSQAGEIQPEARALIERLSTKLAETPAFRVTAARRIDAGVTLSGEAERARLDVRVQRPNKLRAVIRTRREQQELVFDGEKVGLLHRKAGHYAMERLPAATIDEFSRKLYEGEGFRPPIAELLGGNSAEEMMAGVVAAQVVGKERVGWTTCTRAVFIQQGLLWDLWVSDRDGLPRRVLLIFRDREGNWKWDLRFSKWDLDPKFAPDEFVFRVPKGAVRVRMVSSTD